MELRFGGSFGCLCMGDFHTLAEATMTGRSLCPLVAGSH